MGKFLIIFSVNKHNRVKDFRKPKTATNLQFPPGWIIVSFYNNLNVILLNEIFLDTFLLESNLFR